MVLGSHVILSTYGFWLPNDSRGSWSDFVGAWELYRFGVATRVHTRKSLAGRAHNRQVRQDAKKALKYPPVRFTGLQARAVGRGFASYAARSGLTIWECAILPEHVHLVIARHRIPVEQVVNLLKGAATRRLIQEDMHPLAAFPTPCGRTPKAWARGHWRVYLNDNTAICRAVRYVRENPAREGKPEQRWSFVRAFDAQPRSPLGRG